MPAKAGNCDIIGKVLPVYSAEKELSELSFAEPDSQEKTGAVTEVVKFHFSKAKQTKLQKMPPKLFLCVQEATDCSNKRFSVLC